MKKEKIDADTRALITYLCRKYDEYKTRVNSGSAPEGSWAAQIVDAISSAAADPLCEDSDEHAAQDITAAVWASCLDQRLYNFEAFEGRISCGRSAFYQYKNRFLARIRDSLGL